MNVLKKKRSKFLAMLLAFVMVFTTIPVTAFAVESGSNDWSATMTSDDLTDANKVGTYAGDDLYLVKVSGNAETLWFDVKDSNNNKVWTYFDASSGFYTDCEGDDVSGRYLEKDSTNYNIAKNDYETEKSKFSYASEPTLNSSADHLLFMLWYEDNSMEYVLLEWENSSGDDGITTLTANELTDANKVGTYEGDDLYLVKVSGNAETLWFDVKDSNNNKVWTYFDASSGFYTDCEGDDVSGRYLEKDSTNYNIAKNDYETEKSKFSYASEPTLNSSADHLLFMLWYEDNSMEYVLLEWAAPAISGPDTIALDNVLAETVDCYKENDRWNGKTTIESLVENLKENETIKVDADTLKVVNAKKNDGYNAPSKYDSFWLLYEAAMERVNEIYPETDGTRTLASGIKQRHVDAVATLLAEAKANLIPTTEVNATELYELLSPGGFYWDYDSDNLEEGYFARVKESYDHNSENLVTQENCTPVTWKPFETALTEGQDFFDSLYNEDGSATEANTAAKQDEAVKLVENLNDCMAQLVNKSEYVGRYNVYSNRLAEAEALLKAYNPEKLGKDNYTEDSWDTFTAAYNAVKADLEHELQGGTKADYNMLLSFTGWLYNQDNDGEGDLDELIAAYKALTSTVDITVSFTYINNFDTRVDYLPNRQQDPNNEDAQDLLVNSALKLTKGNTALGDAIIASGIIFDTNKIAQGVYDGGSDDMNPLLNVFINGEYYGRVVENTYNTIQLHDGDEVKLVRVCNTMQMTEASTSYDTTAWNKNECMGEDDYRDSIGLINMSIPEGTVKVGDKAKFTATVTGAHRVNAGKSLSPANISLYVSKSGETEDLSQKVIKTPALTDEKGELEYVFSAPGWYTVAMLSAQDDKLVEKNVYNNVTAGEYYSQYAGDWAMIYVAPADDEKALMDQYRSEYLKTATDYFEQFIPEDFAEGYYEDTFQPQFEALKANLESAENFAELKASFEADYEKLQEYGSKAIDHASVIADLRADLDRLPADLNNVDENDKDVLQKIQDAYKKLNEYQKSLLRANEIKKLDEIAKIDINSLKTLPRVTFKVEVNGELPHKSNDGMGGAANKGYTDLTWAVTPNEDGTIPNPAWDKWAYTPDGATITAKAGDYVFARRYLESTDDAYRMMWSADGGDTWNESEHVTYIDYSGSTVPDYYVAGYQIPEDAEEGSEFTIQLKMFTKEEYTEYKKEQPKDNSVTVTLGITQGTKNFYKAEETENIFFPTEMEVPYFDLALYGLEDYYYNPSCYVGVGQKGGTSETADGVVTTMHAFIYATGVYYMGYEPEDVVSGEAYKADPAAFKNAISWTGGAGSTYMDLWDHGTNLNYYLNYEYPLGRIGWGSTSDQQALKDGDIITIHMIEDKNVFGSGYIFFTANDTNGVYDKGDAVDAITVPKGSKVTLTLNKTQNSSDYQTGYGVCAGKELVWINANDANRTVTSWPKDELAGQVLKTDDKGQVTIDTANLEPGTYYIGAEGWIDTTGEIGPAMFALTVEEKNDNHEDVIAMINKLPEVVKINYSNYEKYQFAIERASEAYELLSEEAQANVTNAGKLTDLENTIARFTDIDAVKAMVEALPKVSNLTLEDAEQVDAAKAAYDALGDDQNYLTVAESVKMVQTNAKMDELKAEAAAKALKEAKDTAKKEVADYKNAEDYREAQQAELAEAIEAAKTAIDVAADIEEVDAAVAAAKTAMDAIKTDAQLDKEEADAAAKALAEAKDKAKAEIAEYKNAADYREAQQAELAEAIETAKTAIDVAADIEEVDAAVVVAKTAMDAIKTDAQLDKEEADAAAKALAEAKDAAKKEIAEYKNAADYREAQQAELAAAIEAANTAIEAATDIEAVDAAVAAAKTAMDAIKTDAQLDKEEADATEPDGPTDPIDPVDPIDPDKPADPDQPTDSDDPADNTPADKDPVDENGTDEEAAVNEDSTETGDDSALWIWAMLAIISLGGAGVVCTARRRQE